MRISDWSSDVCSSDLDGSRRDCGHRKSWAPKKNGRENDLESSLRSIGRHVLVDVAGSFAHHRPAWRHRYLSHEGTCRGATRSDRGDRKSTRMKLQSIMRT